jgi:hypothetical protein
MRGIHPSKVELAWLSDLDNDQALGAEVADHLRWCADCRSMVADHRWLQEEITTTLMVAADTVPLPRPKWWAVQETLLARQQRQAASWRGSAVASIVLAVCLILSASPVLGTAAILAQTVQMSPDAVIATAPDVKVPPASISTLATPTPAMFPQMQKMTLSPTPVLVLPPTPDQSEI